jgi:hypothetical protein
VENEKMFPVPFPKDVTADAGATVKRIWERRVDEYVNHENKLAANCETVFSLMLGQCSESMRAKLESLDSYENMKDGFDTIALIKAIKGLIYQFDGQKYHSMALHQAKKRLYNLYQGLEMANAQFLDTFHTCVTIVDQFGGTAVKNESKAMGILDAVTATTEQKVEASQIARDKYLSAAYIAASDKTRYGKLLEDLENDFTKGTSNYPVNITSAYSLVVNNKNYLKAGGRLINDTEGVSFANVGRRQVDRSKVKCYNCNVLGHYANECTEEKADKAGRNSFRKQRKCTHY